MMNPLNFVRTSTVAPNPATPSTIVPSKHTRMKSVSLKVSRAVSKAKALVRMQTQMIQESVITSHLSCKEKEVYDKFIHEMQIKKQETVSCKDGRAALRKQLFLNCNGNRQIVQLRKQLEEQRRVPAAKKVKKHPTISSDSTFVERIVKNIVKRSDDLSKQEEEPKKDLPK